MNRSKKISESISAENISYYNKIAAQYDELLDQDKKNSFIRNKVANTFRHFVKAGRVLDFGGGTGLDLIWLLQEPYNIVFCEPAVAMRKMAQKRMDTGYPGSAVLFLEDEMTDFRKWNEKFPFSEKIDAVLANFAMFNCIPDIPDLFDKLAMVIKPGGMIIALILDSSLLKRFRSNLKGTVKSFFSGKPVALVMHFNGERQTVNLHSEKEIRKASKTAFDLIQYEQLQGFGFTLIHLVKK